MTTINIADRMSRGLGVVAVMFLLSGCGGGGDDASATGAATNTGTSGGTTNDSATNDSATNDGAADNMADGGDVSNDGAADNTADNTADAANGANGSDDGGTNTAAPAAIFTHVAGKTVQLNGTTYYKGSRTDPDYGLRTDATRTVYRFELHSGDPGNSGDIPAGRDRYELVTLRDGSQPDRIYPADTDIWFSYSLMIEPGAPITAPRVVVGQLHNLPDAGVAASPSFYFQLQNLDAQTVTYALVTRGTGDPSAILKAPGVVRWSTPLSRGRWIAIVARVRTSSTGDGQVELWANGDRVLDVGGLTIGYPAPVDAIYWQFGLYRPIEPNPLAARYANMEVGTTSLLQRVSDPLPIPPAVR